MTLRNLLEKLERLTAEMPIENLDLPVLGMVGSSGETFDVGSIFEATVHEADMIGPICDMEELTPYIQIYLGN